MGFWLYCFVMTLLCPGVMIGFGLRFLKRPPKKINHFYGYRTRRSMSSQEAWDFAHQCCGRIWLRLGLVSVPPAILAMLCALGRDAGQVGCWCGVVVTVQVVLLVVTIPVVEHQLKENFGI